MNALLPTAATVQAATVDRIFTLLLVVAGVITLLVVGLLAVFSLRYRRGSSASRGAMPEWMSREWEIGWTSATLLLCLFIFWWAASANLRGYSPPPGALEIHILAKQWMWEAEQQNGVREINALHVPIDRPVRLLMTSQDVIHSFFVPAFRVKQDVLPGRDAPTQIWFQANRLGTFRTALCRILRHGSFRHAGRDRRDAPGRFRRMAEGSTAGR